MFYLHLGSHHKQDVRTGAVTSARRIDRKQTTARCISYSRESLLHDHVLFRTTRVKKAIRNTMRPTATCLHSTGGCIFTASNTDTGGCPFVPRPRRRPERSSANATRHLSNEIFIGHFETGDSSSDNETGMDHAGCPLVAVVRHVINVCSFIQFLAVY